MFIFTKILKIPVAIYLLLFSFFIYLPLSDLILAIKEYKGIDNPLARVGCKYLLCVCACTAYSICMVSPTGSIKLSS